MKEQLLTINISFYLKTIDKLQIAGPCFVGFTWIPWFPLYPPIHILYVINTSKRPYANGQPSTRALI